MKLGTECKLAVAGGRPVRTKPFAPWPQVDEDEIAAVTDVLRSGRINYWTGDQGRLFESEFAQFAECKYGIAVANGTVALELALYAAGIGSGDEVIVPSRTFIASASSVVMRGAVPVLVDVDRESQTITVDTIRPWVSSRTRAIMAVHLAGWPCDMDPIMAFAADQRLVVIEDCAQAHGAAYKHRPVGSLGHVGTFSFCQDKIMTTGGEGGMLVTNDETLWERAWSFKDHGKSYNTVFNEPHTPGFRWLHDSFGTNWRLTEIQSALGRQLLRKLPDRVKRRQHLASVLNSSLKNCPGLRIAVPPKYIQHSYYKFYAFVRNSCLRADWTRDRLVDAISAEGVPCFTGSCSEIFKEKAFPKRWHPSTDLPVAQELGHTSLMFLVHSTLSEDDMNDVCKAIHKVMTAATSRQSMKSRLETRLAYAESA